jgi:hypothetical protein
MIRHHPPSTPSFPRPDGPHVDALRARPGAGPTSRSLPENEPPSTRTTTMHDALTRVLQLASVRDMDWVTAHFGHR